MGWFTAQITPRGSVTPGADPRTSATRLGVPVLDGAAELDARRSLAHEWHELLKAPSKHLVTPDGAAHAVAFEQADDVQATAGRRGVPGTTRGRS